MCTNIQYNPMSGYDDEGDYDYDDIMFNRTSRWSSAAKAVARTFEDEDDE